MTEFEPPAAAMPDHEQPSPAEGPEPNIQPQAPTDDPAYEPLPPEAESAASVSARLEAEQRQPPPAGPARFNEDKQLTLRQLMLVTLLLAVCLGVLRLVNPEIAAGVLGYAVLAGVILTGMLNLPLPLVVQLTWWGLVVIYVMMGIAAFAHMHMK